MILSELISQAERLLKTQGDVPVRMAVVESEEDSTDCAPVAGFSIMVDDDDKALHVLICDQATIDAFVSSSDDEA